MSQSTGPMSHISQAFTARGKRKCSRPHLESLEGRDLTAGLHPIQIASPLTSGIAAPTAEVVSVGKIRSHNGISGLVITYSNSNGMSGVTERTSYTVSSSTHGGPWKPQRVRKVIYDPSSQTAAVFLVRNLQGKPKLNLSIDPLLAGGPYTSEV